LNPTLLEEAMRPFAQLSNSSARRYRGLGLGLAVVRRQIAAMNGQLELRPRDGGGSVFVATVPVKIVEEAVRSVRMPLAPRKPAQAPPPLPAAHRKPARNPF
jgi:light-regulated signal transduction histidine kinase (bacteriophytochrome)